MQGAITILDFCRSDVAFPLKIAPFLPMSTPANKGFTSTLRGVWKDPVWSKIISVAILAVLASIWATIKGKWHAIGSGLWSLLESAWMWLGNTTNVWNWLLIALVGIAVLVAVVLLRVMLESRNQVTPATENDYRTDLFEGLRWYWDYDYFNRISGLFPCCPDCLLQLEPQYDTRTYSHGRIYYDCEHCKTRKASFDEAHDKLEGRVERLIHQKLRSGEWRNVPLPQRITKGTEAIKQS